MKNDLHVFLRLNQVLLPLLLQVLVHGASNRLRVDLNAAKLCFKSLKQKFFHLIVLHGRVSF